MRKVIAGASLCMLAAAAPAVPAAARKAAGTPQRSSAAPPGLAKLLGSPNRGILRALLATEGSNSRLQDVPVSP